MRLRRAGRYEAAVQLLTEVVALAAEGKSEAEQMAPALAPLYYEYGVALVGVARGRAAAAAEAREAGDAAEQSGPAAKRPRVCGAETAGEGDSEAEEDADEGDVSGAESAGEGDSEAEEDVDEGDDAVLAWQLLDQARCIFQGAGDAAGAARCAEQLAGRRPCGTRFYSRLDVDEGRWADAVVEFSACVDWYETQAGLGLEDRARHASCVAGLAAAYAEHARAAPGVDLTVEGEHGAPVPVAAAAECPERAARYAVRAEQLTDALLTSLAGAGGEVAAARKRQLCALAVEVQHAKDLAAGLTQPNESVD